MARLFGFSIEDNQRLSKSAQSPVPPNSEDGVDYFLSSGFFGQYVDIEGVYKTEFDLIKRYREMSLHPECDNAIEDVVNEAIVSDSNDHPIDINLDNLNAGDTLKKVIRQEFKYVLDLLDFDKKCHEIFRNWYVDGRIFYHKIIDLKRPQDGIQEIRHIDSAKIRFIRQEKKKEDNIRLPNENLNKDAKIEPPEIEEYFLYNPQTRYGIGNYGANKGGIKLAKDAVSYCYSGLVDRNKQTSLSYLHKAIKSLNQLRMIEDALVIYRLSRAPERRVFYIDVGNLPKVKAESYLRDVMQRYRNKLVYDANTGEIRDDKKFMSMMEDFWLPRREGGRGTEISTLPGGQNLGELADIQYFQKKLYKSLNVPDSRITGESGFNLGRSSEILRDELKFTKFVGRLRKRFSNLFLDMLKTQLVLKNVIALEDWDRMSEHIQFDFLYDNHFSELKEAELMNERLGLAANIDPYVGKYYSVEYVRKKILRQTEEEVIEIDDQIKKEMDAGIIIDPNLAPTEPVGQDAAGPELGNVPQDQVIVS